MKAGFDNGAAVGRSSGRKSQGALVALLVGATASRLLPHAPNFTAVPAVALMSGVLFGRSRLAFCVPLVAMLLSDLALGAVVYGTRAFQWLLPVYACIACTVVIGRCTARTWTSVVFGAVAATATFFLVTNFFVWASGGFYAASWAGLLACYAAAVPFAWNMLLSSLAFSLGLLLMWNQVEHRFAWAVKV